MELVYIIAIVENMGMLVYTTNGQHSKYRIWGALHLLKLVATYIYYFCS